MSRASIEETSIKNEKALVDADIPRARGAQRSGSLDEFKPNIKLVRPIRVVDIDFKDQLKHIPCRGLESRSWHISELIHRRSRF